jgi:bud site selection protein 20
LDQILNDDLGSEKSILSLQQQELDETKPGLGQFYCIPCAKYFENEKALAHHQRGKVHKRRLKVIKQGPYTVEEADMAAGHNVQKFLNKKQKQESITAEPIVSEILTRPPQEEEDIKDAAQVSEMQVEAIVTDTTTNLDEQPASPVAQVPEIEI